jgi:hypothetical protein
VTWGEFSIAITTRLPRGEKTFTEPLSCWYKLAEGLRPRLLTLPPNYALPDALFRRTGLPLLHHRHVLLSR